MFKRVFCMALKDLRVLSRDKMGAFFILGFPVLMGLFFGLMNTGIGGSKGTAKMKVAIVDNDNSEISKKYVQLLRDQGSLEMEAVDLESAKASVRKGQRVAMLVLDEGFGKTAGVFWEEAPTIQLGVDPSRNAESGMLQGYLMEAIGELVAARFQDTSGLRDSILSQKQQIESDQSVDPGTKLLLGALFGSVESMMDNMDALQDEETDQAGDSPAATGPSFNFVEIEPLDISREVDPQSVRGQLQKIRSKWDISFPQAMLWGVLGCVAGFAISIAKERTNGTLVRLQVAPVSRLEILCGKALACFMTALVVITLMTVLGMMLGMRPASFAMLVLAAVCVSFCFVGIMMVMSVLGKTEQAVGGSGWAINMVMAMLGGCMIPVMFMPAIIQKLSMFSPISWALLAIEGAIWRGFTIGEMFMPCAILLSIGVVGIFVGTAILQRSD